MKLLSRSHRKWQLIFLWWKQACRECRIRTRGIVGLVEIQRCAAIFIWSGDIQIATCRICFDIRGSIIEDDKQLFGTAVEGKERKGLTMNGSAEGAFNLLFNLVTQHIVE